MNDVAYIYLCSRLLLLGGFVSASIGIVRVCCTRRDKRAGRTRLILVTAASIPIAVFASLQVQDGAAAKARNSIRKLLARPGARLSLPGVALTPAEERELITDLATLVQVAPHHSGPTKTTTVTIHAGGEDLTLQLRRDSEFGNEYWVFSEAQEFGWMRRWPLSFLAPSSEIGRTRSKVLR